MITPADLGLPYGEWRREQWDIISRAVSSDKSIILIEAPPGIGKTGIAIALARILGSSAHYLTATKVLQRQYLELSGLVGAMGRNNFPCLIDESVSADQGICTVGMTCEFNKLNGMDGCGYWDQKRLAVRSPEVVFNYAYWLYQMNLGQSFDTPDVLVCDEAHTVKDQVRGFVTVTMWHRTLEEATVDEPPRSDDFEVHKDWAAENVFVVSQALGELREQRGDASREWVRKVSRVERLKENMKFLAKRKDDWVVVRGRKFTEYRPVWVDTLVPSAVLAHKGLVKTVFMSATILDKEAYCKLHGMTPEDVEFIRAGSTFSKIRRPIRYYPVEGKINKEANPIPFLNAVRDCIDQHPDESGIIHTTSYWLRDLVLTINNPRFMSHNGEDRERVLEQFKKTPGAILVSPSMTMGVDLPYDLLRWQVIAKLPFPDLGDPQIKKAMKQEPCPSGPCAQCKNGWITNKLGQLAYNYATVATLVQTYGRGMRADDDYCMTYLLDGSWKWFRVANRDMIPAWFRDAVQRWNPYE
jgi:ATP-dependent DNA helicase DinG